MREHEKTHIFLAHFAIVADERFHKCFASEVPAAFDFSRSDQLLFSCCRQCSDSNPGRLEHTASNDPLYTPLPRRTPAIPKKIPLPLTGDYSKRFVAQNPTIEATTDDRWSVGLSIRLRNSIVYRKASGRFNGVFARGLTN